MKYYRLLDDLRLRNRWFLGDINFLHENDMWNYISANEVINLQDNYAVDISQKGKPLDLTFGNFEILICNGKAAEIFGNDVQKISITIKGEVAQYFIIVIKSELDCIDKEQSVFKTWEIGNEIRPDLAGTYQCFSKIVVDPKKINDQNIFRIKGFNVAVIVSSKIKNLFESNNFSGVTFREV